MYRGGQNLGIKLLKLYGQCSGSVYSYSARCLTTSRPVCRSTVLSPTEPGHLSCAVTSTSSRKCLLGNEHLFKTSQNRALFSWASCRDGLCSNAFQDRTPIVQSVRWKKRITAPKKKKTVQDEVEETDSDSDENTDNEGEDSGDESDDELSRLSFKEDNAFPPNYKEVKSHMQTVRLDAVLSAGLNISRSKIEDYFLSGQTRLNGAKALKKHSQMEVGDYTDLVVESEADEEMVKRVRVLKIEESKGKDKALVYLRAWRGAVSVPKA